ncbi:DUF3105 domain-containing protein [Modestobacter sp. SSW1-42]|uniref:DUF3105 domain-containing protein n=1 Tax=Modestobacter sp. SSW1-42 TaxID=596372 RepID=UPI003987A0E9
MAKDPKPRSGGATRAGSTGGRAPGGKGRTRPPANVVTPQRPWGLIAAAVAVAVFAVAVLGYAVISVNRSNANKVTSADQIADLATFDYAGAQHVTTPVTYTESPPVGGPHDNEWADCTGTVYDVDIRHENAVHSLEHGAVWITYNPDTIADGDLATLEELVDGRQGMMLSPYAGLTSPISLQSWNHQLFVDSAGDERVEQYADFMVFNADFYPEPGATCENPSFISDPLVVGDQTRVGAPAVPSDAPVSETPAP